MMQNDDWGRDPGVRHLRQVFAAVEQTSEGLLAAWEVDRFDLRLRRWRQRALELFQRAWALAGSRGRAVGPQEAAWLYGRSLAAVLAAEGRAVEAAPAELLGPDWTAEVVREAGS